MRLQESGGGERHQPKGVMVNGKLKESKHVRDSSFPEISTSLGFGGAAAGTLLLLSMAGSSASRAGSVCSIAAACWGPLWLEPQVRR